MNNDAIAAIQTSLSDKVTVVYVQRLGVWGPLGTARSIPALNALLVKAAGNRWVTGTMVITKTTSRSI